MTDEDRRAALVAQWWVARWRQVAPWDGITRGRLMKLVRCEGRPVRGRAAGAIVGLAVGLILGVGGCRGGERPAGASAGAMGGATAAGGGASSGGAARSAAPGTSRAASDDAADGDWPMPAKDYANTRYSALHEIDTTNVRGLRLVWSFSTGTLRGHEGQPLVVGNTMYAVTPFPNTVYAFDLTKEDFPLKWKYRPAVNPAAEGVACCDVVNRGLAFADGKLVFNTLDGQTIGLEAATGRELWKVQLADLARGETMTMAPIIVHGKAIVGDAGGEMGVHGWIAAVDLATGKLVWRAYSTGPDSLVRIDQRTFRPYYAKDRGVNLGATTWPTDAWKIGGGAVWGWISYDPELDLIYYGTSNPGPYNPPLRPGDNKWTATIFARDPDDGYARWAYQQTPHDNWDYDGITESVLADLPIGGATRKVLVHFDRNGFAYVMDRATGQVLSAEPYVAVNWAKGVDLATGEPRRVPAKETGPDHWTRDICPSLEGGKDPQPVSFDPGTRLFYVPSNNICMDWISRSVSYIAGTPYMGYASTYHAGPGGYKGALLAWDPVQAKVVWKIPSPYPVWSGVLSTGGGVVFYGTLDGYFRAVNARSGRDLWKLKIGSGVLGAPITFRGPDGKQYVAIYSGVGGDMGALVAGDVRSDAPYDTRTPSDFLPDLARHTSWGGTIWVFAL